MITRFETLVARDSMGDCFTEDGHAVTVIAFKKAEHGRWIVEVTAGLGETWWVNSSELTAGRDICRLIDNGTYNEEKMQHRGYKGMITTLSY